MNTKKARKSRKKSIPDEVKQQVDQIVADFNRTVLKGNPNYYFVARYRGDCVYLDRRDFMKFGPICRLTYTGDMARWEFAIYKYSREAYDPDEWFFPGSGHVDGTVEGAMRAGLAAYP
ncbi:MAG: hypothetical protein ACREEM_17375 [Blastocatellia bacterium]